MSFVLHQVGTHDSTVLYFANASASNLDRVCQVGNSESEVPSDIRLSGAAIQDQHCFFEHPDDGTVTLTAIEGGITMVNGRRLEPGKVS
jgi:hypothetical protein